MAQQPHPKPEMTAASAVVVKVDKEAVILEPKIDQVALATSPHGHQLVALLSDGSLWHLVGESWQSIPLPPPCLAAAKTSH